ncbi:MAG: hypothetical protein IT456_14235 [Planctomycetes bacterium]|jgi:hypothetical protein|nr:hypothetical protein [Planctomycetota bacterium]
MKPHIPFLACLVAVAATAQDPAKVPAPPTTNADIKVTPAPTQKVDRPAETPGGSSTLTVPQKTVGTGTNPSPVPPLPRGILHDEVDGRLWAIGGTYKASFGAEGATFLPYFADAERNHPMLFSVRAARVAEQDLLVQQASPTRNGEVVSFDHGGLRAVYELRQSGVEQMFWFDSLPARGELHVDVALATDLQATRDGEGYVFDDARGQVTYSGAVAIDADGNRLAIPTELANGVLHFRVPAAFVEQATLPLCIDPLLGNTQNVYTTANTRPAWQSDIAYEPSYGEYMIVYERQWSLTDRDVYATRYTFDLATGTAQVLDGSTIDWSQPRVAANNAADRFLMVAKISNGNVSPYWIGGRMVDASTGALGTPFDIERAGAPGNFIGDKINPDVGGDMDYQAPSYFTVVWERVASASDHDVHSKQVTVAGAVRTTTPILIENSTTFESFPRISKTNGIPPYAAMAWGIVWETRYSATDQDLYGATMRWDGTVTVASHSIDTGTYNSWRPTVSSPTDGSGSRYNLVTFEVDSAGPGTTDIRGNLLDQSGAYQGSWDLSQNVNGAWPQYAPTVDSDGARFVVGWTQIYGGSGTDADTVLTTFGFNPVAGLTLQDSAYPGYSTDAEYDLSITCTHAAGSGAGRYGACWTRAQIAAPNDYSIEARLYDGMSSQGGLSTRATGCGTDADYQTFGAPLLGGWVHLSQYATAGLRGYVFGFPTSVPVSGCAGCTIGVTGNSTLGSEMQIEIPADSSFLGMQLACQGFSFASGNCFGTVSLSNTLDLVLR